MFYSIHETIRKGGTYRENKKVILEKNQFKVLCVLRVSVVNSVYIVRETSSFLILAMALAGFRLFGQVLVQFIMV